MGLGSVALWGLVAIATSTVLSKRIPRAAWRAVHALAFGTFLLALAHGVAAGTDSDTPVVAVAYAAALAVLLGAVIQRVLLARLEASRRG